MPITFGEYARMLQPFERRPRGFQRVLCNLGIHRWHRSAHLHSLIRRFNRPMPELRNLPFVKMDGNEYTYVPRG